MHNGRPKHCPSSEAPRQAVKELKLAIDALLSQVIDGKGFLHYGYWPDRTADEISLSRLARAQQAYFDELAGAIPDGTKSVLDVGSGTGSNAVRLIQKGYGVECVCPSAKLNEIAKQKLPAGTVIHECLFEDLATDKVYDLLLFAESFHYLDAARALPQVAARARKSVVIFDYFPRQEGGARQGISHRQFTQMLSEVGVFRIVSDRDVTGCITPTFEVLDRIANNHVRPFVAQAIAEFKADHQVWSFFLNYPIRKLARRLAKASNKHATFPQKFEYRLIVLARN
jgi:SAM-dependent methyltransferase